MSTFYLVRHAHADWTPNEARSLLKQGFRDTERVADILQSYPVQLIYAAHFAACNKAYRLLRVWGFRFTSFMVYLSFFQIYSLEFLFFVIHHVFDHRTAYSPESNLIWVDAVKGMR